MACAVGAALLLLLLALPTVDAAKKKVTLPSLNASGMVAASLAFSTQVRPGPYFANEALLVHITLRNTGRKALTIQQPEECPFAAQAVVLGQKHAPTAPALPPADLCASLGGTSTQSVPPGGQLTGTAITAIPLLTGKAGQKFTVQLRARAVLTVAGMPKATNPTLLSGHVTVTAVSTKSAGGGVPQQTLRIYLAKDAQGFTVRVGDGNNRPVADAQGWYVIHAPDGNLSWGQTAAGQTYCGPDCRVGAKKGAYTLTVTMVRDGFSLATATLTYKVK
jgi:hypothetical protein